MKPIAALILTGTLVGACGQPLPEINKPLSDLTAADAQLKSLHLGGPLSYQIARDPSGRVSVVAGEFDVAAAGPDDYAASARRFLREQSASLRTAPDTDGIVFTSTHEAGMNQTVLEAHQSWRTLRILGTSMTFVYDDDHLLRGFSGRLVDEADYASDETIGSDDILRIVEEDSGLERDAVVTERVVDAERGVVAWEVRTNRYRFLVDETTGEIYSKQSNSRGKIEQVGVRHRSYTIDDLDVPAGTQVDEIALSAQVSYGWLCTYRLEWGKHEGYKWAIERIKPDSNNATKAEISFPCSLDPPAFDASGFGNTEFRQQDTYYWTKRTRDELAYGFAASAPNKTNSVLIEIDDDDDACDGEQFAGCFTTNIWGHPRIYLVKKDKLWRFSSPAHEYGHYFVWADGDLDYHEENNCKPFEDEARPLNESVAEVTTFFLAHREYRPRYDATFPGRSRHSSGSGIQHPGAPDCVDANTYRYGRGFEQAMWEALYGIDCTDSSVDCLNYNGRGEYGSNSPIGWSNSRTARRQLIKALAYALDATGQNATYSQIRVWMYMYLLANEDFEVALNVNSVMMHHGF